MYPVKQSTALDIVFFAHDANGDSVTGKVDGDFTKRISKNGAAFGAMTVTITEREGGWYHMQLSTSHTDTLGILTIYLTASGIKQVNLQYRIHVRINDDFAFPTTSGRSIDVTATGGVGVDWGNVENQSTAVNLSATNIDVDQVVASVSGAVGSVTGNVGGNVVGSVGSVAAGGITAASIATDAIDSDALAASAVTEIQSGLSTLTTAQVNAEVVDALNVDTYAEPGSVPAATATITQMLHWLFTLARNKRTTTSTTDTLRNDADNATIAASTLSDDGTTFTRGEYV